MASPRRRAERSALKYFNSVYVAIIFTKLKRVVFDFASRGAISCDCTARDRTQSYT
jgi:phosphopantetheine adenylyltransferase